MPEFDQREYQTVILGALLHDVGKGTSFGLGKYEVVSQKDRLKLV